MKKLRLMPWLVVLAVLVLGTLGLAYLLRGQGATTLARLALVLGQVLTYAWVGAGLVRWRHVGWVGKVSRVITVTLVAALLGLSSLALGFTSTAIMFAGIWGMSIVFILGLELLRLLLSAGHPVLGVARTLLDEAIRMKMALIFVVGVILLVPFLPFMLGGETRLQYRIESFLTYSLTIITTLLSFMTILLAVRTVSSELSERQMFLTMTKPVSRAGYLLGKWVGVMSLNALLVVVAGVGVYAFVQVLRTQPAMDIADYAAVQEQVLTARASATPRPVDDSVLQIDFEERLRELRLRNPARFGDPNAPITQVTDEQRRQVQLESLREWLTVPTRGSTTYRFTGLADAKAAGPTVQLRFEPKAASAPPDELVRLQFRVNGRDYFDPRSGRPLPPVRNNTVHTAYIDSQVITDDGTLDLTVINAGADLGQTSVAFGTEEGLVVFYKVGSFTGNLARGLVVLWVRMSFLAALGLAAATFLGFPVACLLCFIVFFAAVGSDYLAESLRSYAYLPSSDVPWWFSITDTFNQFGTKFGEGKYYDCFKILIRLIGEAFTFVVPPLSRYSPTQLVAYGRVVDTDMLLGVVWRIGIVSSGVVGVAAVWAFNRREIARVTV